MRATDLEVLRENLPATGMPNGHARYEGDDWPKPDLFIVSPHRAAAPELPLDLFGPYWSGWIADAAEAKGSPPDYVAAALIAGVGSMLARVRAASPWEGWVEPPIIWWGAVGNPSAGKSPGIDAATGILRELETELAAEFPATQRQYKADAKAAEFRRDAWEKDVAEAVKKGWPAPPMPENAVEPDKPELPRLIVTDVTAEKLVRMSAGNDRGLLLVRDEGAGWLGQMDKYGGTGSDRAMWLEAFGGRPYVLDRVKADKPIRTESLAVGIVCGIQPDRLATMLLSGDDDGLAARFIWSWPEPRKPCRPTRGLDANGAIVRLRRILAVSAVSAHACISLSSDAAELIQAWREDVAQKETQVSGLMVSWLGKLPGYAVRLSLVIEYLWWVGQEELFPEPTGISQDATHTAIAFLDAYAVPMAYRVFGDAGVSQADRDAHSLAKWIINQQTIPDVVNARELRRAGALPTQDPERYDYALQELSEVGWVRRSPHRPSNQGGRRKKDWCLNPALRGTL